MKTFLVILISSHVLFEINAGIITSGHGISVASRLNRDGLTSTVIKTQQLNDEDQRRIQNSPETVSSFDDSAMNENEKKNDDSHFRLYYKSDSPGRSLKHEVEHRYFQKPAMKQIYQENVPYNFEQSLPGYYSRDNEFDNNKQTMFNLHYHKNFKGFSNQDQQGNLRKNVFKMLLMNMVQNQNNQQLRQKEQQNRFSSNSLNNNNGVEYKIVHLTFKIEPQQGIVGQGVVETDNGAGSIINSRHFSLLPRELPDLVRRLLYAAQRQPFEIRNNNYSIKKKRSQNDDSFEAASTKNDSNLNDLEFLDTTTTRMNKKNIENNDDDKMNENEFQESLKSLQRRDDNYENDSLSDESDFSSERLSRNDEESDLDNAPQL